MAFACISVSIVSILHLYSYNNPYPHFFGDFGRLSGALAVTLFLGMRNAAKGYRECTQFFHRFFHLLFLLMAGILTSQYKGPLLKVLLFIVSFMSIADIMAVSYSAFKAIN